tara:strand:+ start:1519 stop:2610 length:1092 start_codon:yes stop_codon:yes gene_type:complete
MIKKKLLIATGGTGGHIFPAYSLAKNLMNDYTVELIADKRGLNFLKKYKDLNLIILPSSPLNKKNFFTVLFSILIIIYSIIRSIFFLLLNRPAIVFGMGGYSSFPICIAASILKIKFIIYENNLIIGKANKYLLPFAKKIFVSYKELEGIPLNYKNKVIEIGNIIREEIIYSNKINEDKNIKGSFKILILGGSQAAKIFAEELPQILKKINDDKIPIKVYQQCQKIQNNDLLYFYKENRIECEVFNFTNDIIDYYLNSDLVITRSGASVLGELINIKIPFISIPLPTAADNHQYKNAEFYFKKGYGYLLEEKFIKTKLFDLIKNILKNKNIIEKVLSSQKLHSDRNTFQNLRNSLKEILHEKN